MRRFLGTTLAALVIASGFTVANVTLTQAPASAASSVNGTITRSEVIARAKYWVSQGTTYCNCGTETYAADLGNTKTYRRDCSGLVSMAWHIDQSRSTGTFEGWSGVTVLPSFHDMKPGDAMNRHNTAYSDHIELFSHWKNPADHAQGAYVYSFNTTNETIQNPDAVSNFGNLGFNSWSDILTYETALRYNNIVDDIPLSEAGKVDVNGDGKADLVAQNGDSIWVRLSTGTSFGAGSQWGTGTFSGSVANLAGDVNGDGKADLIAQNGDNVWVRTSTGYSFNAPAHWGTVPFSGNVANMIGDVNGDGRDDLIAQNGDSVWVRTSTGSTFNTPQQWGTGAFSGNKANHIADVDGDGKADMVAHNADSVWVRISNGTGFNAPSQWALGTFTGSVANLIDDLNGDGRDDLIAMNGDSIWVRISNGTGFNAPSQWALDTFSGNLANHAADVDGNGKADLIAQNGDSIWVRESLSVGLTSPAQWALGAFSGSVANHG